MSSSRLPMVLLGLPIKGKRNPYIIVLSRDNIVEFDVEVDGASTPEIIVRGEPPATWRLEHALRSFVEVICSRLEQPLKITVSYAVKGIEYPPQSGLYAVLSKAVIEAVAEAGGYDLGPAEVLEAAKSIDEEAGTDYDFVDGMRRALVRGKHIIYREGEEPITFEVGHPLELRMVGEEEVHRSFEDELGEAVITMLTKLAGTCVVEAARERRNWARFLELLRLLSRVENAVYYTLFDVAPPAEGCKWTPSLQAVYGVCLEGEEGEPLVFA